MHTRCISQVDVEGYEPSVVMSGTDLLRDRVQNVLLEYSPGIYERLRDFEGLSTLPSSLASLLKRGFVAGHMPMRIATPWPPKVCTYSRPWYGRPWYGRPWYARRVFFEVR